MPELVIALDIGNTNIHIGLGNHRGIRKRWVYCHQKYGFVKQLKKSLRDKPIKAGAIASVVPGLTRKVSSVLKDLGVKPFIISSKTVPNLKLRYKNPESLGVDRIANVVGALSRYKTDIIIIDAGTATTIDVALKTRTYLGGLILPGISASLDYLHQRTALLPRIKPKKPKDIIGHSTTAGIQSGLYYGITEAIKGIINKIKERLNRPFSCIATGGWGKLLYHWIDDIEYFEPVLSLYGILNIYYENVKDE